MVDIKTFREIALSFDGTEERPHFDRAAFKIVDRKIFATLHAQSETANMVFSLNDQAVYCSYDAAAIYPVPNKWGLRGWTTFELNKLPDELVADALLTAYNGILSGTKRKKR